MNVDWLTNVFQSLCNACGIKFRKEKEKRCNGTDQ